MKPLSLSDAVAKAAGGVKKAALGTRYVAEVHSVTDRETTGWVICDVFFRDPAADGRVTVRVNDAVDLAASDLIYIRHDSAGQKTFIFDGFVKGGGTGHNDAGAYVPWVQSPGATSPVGQDYEIAPAPGQDAIIDGVNWSNFKAMQFVLMAASGEVANERVLTAGDGVSLTDAGAGGAATLAVDLVAAWSGLEISAGDLRVDLDANFDFAGVITATGGIVMPDGGTIGQAAGPRLRFDDTNNYLEITGCSVGIGTTIPSDKLTIVGGNQSIWQDQANAELYLYSYKDTATAGWIRVSRARGTFIAIAAAQDDDLIGGFIGNAYTGAAWSASAQVDFVVDGAMGANRLPGRVHLRTSDGSAGPAIRMTIDKDGNIIIGTTAAGATAARALALSNAATAPTASANLVHLYAEDVSASAVLAVYQETAPIAVGTFTPSHKWLVRINGVSYYVRLDAV